MKTTKDPYKRKIGLNLSNTFFKLLDKKSLPLLDLLFMRNEREALGRRLLIMIYVLQGHTYDEIIRSLGCGVSTIRPLAEKLEKYNDRDRKKLLRYLTNVFYSQFPKVMTKKYVAGSRTLIKIRQVLLENSKNPGKDKTVPLL